MRDILQKPLSDYEINQRVNQILSGGKIQRKELYNIIIKIKSFRNPKYLERYEDVFDLENTLVTTAGSNAHHTKDGYRFVVNNTGEVTPFDWYHARASLDFKVQKLVGGDDSARAIALTDDMGI